MPTGAPTTAPRPTRTPLHWVPTRARITTKHRAGPSNLVVALYATRYIDSVIMSFKHKGLRRFYETGSTGGIQPAHRKRLRLQLAALDTATRIEDMDIPGFRLHPLKGELSGLWSISVSGNWRITFEFRDGNAYVVNYEDYH